MAERRIETSIEINEAWLGDLLVPGVFDGEHCFLPDVVAQNRTRLTHGENFSGLLVGLLGSALSATKASFENMNIALEEEAE